MGDEDDAPDGPVPDGPLWAADFVVPDDISELADEVAAYHREQRAARRPTLSRHLGGTGWSKRLVVPLMALLILCAGVSGSVLASLAPHFGPAPSAQPLAHPNQAPGTVGGLLPDVSAKSLDGTTVRLLALRPAMFVLVPNNCDCPRILDSLAGHAEEVSLPMVLVATNSGRGQLPVLISKMHVGSPQGLIDNTGTLWADYRPTGITVLLLAPNGRVPYPALHRVTAGAVLDDQLFKLLP